MTVSRDFLARLSRTIRRASDHYEREGNVVVTDEARKFLRAVIVESATYRRREWIRNERLDISRASEVPRALSFVEDRVQLLFGGSEAMELDGRSYIGVISLIQAIHGRWCGVWPFCR
jgi:hypothetical protein